MGVTLARFHEFNNPIIGCSEGFLKMTGRSRSDTIGRNCRFLNQGLEMPNSTRERLHHTIRTGTPFMGILKNRRRLNGVADSFDNLLHMVVVFAGVRSYILGIQVDVTGLHLDLADGSQDAQRLQLMFDSVLSSGTDSWIHFQEGRLQVEPIYLYIRHQGDSNDQIKIVEAQDQGSEWAVQQAPDQYLVLAPQFLPLEQQDDKPPGRWMNEPFGGEECPVASYTVSRTPSPPMDRDMYYAHELPCNRARMQRDLQSKTKTQNPREEGDAAESPGSGSENGMERQVSGSGSGSGSGRQVSGSGSDTRVGSGSGSGNGSGGGSGSGSGNGGGSARPTKGCARYASGGAPPTPENKAFDSQLVNKDTWTPTMKTQLQALDLEDPQAVIIARGISKLGLSAGESVRHFFSTFGNVKAVHIPYTFKKRKQRGPDVNGSAREIRSPGRCFIVMSSPEERSRILADSKEYMVHGVKVTLEAFSAIPYSDSAPCPGAEGSPYPISAPA